VDIYLTVRFTWRLRHITAEKVQIAIYISHMIFLIQRFWLTITHGIAGIYVMCTRSEMNLSPFAYFTWNLVLSSRHTHSSRSRYRRELYDNNYRCVLFLFLTSDIRRLITNGYCPRNKQFSIYYDSAGMIKTRSRPRVTRYYYGGVFRFSLVGGPKSRRVWFGLKPDLDIGI